jgi:hypothetical protein
VSTYREIIGKKIKKVSSDPSSGTDGEMWYNSTTGTLRGPKLVEAWSSGAPINTTRYGSGGAGTQTAGLMIGGNVGPSDTRSTAVEEYNGSGWATGGALPTATRSLASAGIQTAAFAAGGYDTANTAEAYTYDGSSWTGIPALNTARSGLNVMGSGTTTAGLVAGGLIEPPYSNTSEEYNGSSWSEGDNLNTARSTGGSAGIQTATILAGGYTGSDSAKAEQYDGTSWSEGPDINTARRGLGAAGTQTSAIIVGGRSPDKDATETWDGTSWTTSPATLATARYDVAPANAGTSSTWMVAGGYGPSSIRNLTEEFNASTDTITAAAWASGGNLNQGRYWLGSANQAPSSAALGFAGYLTPGNTMYTLTEEYDGTSWTEKADLALARSKVGGAGTATAALCIGGYVNGVGTKSEVEEFNGSAWSEENNIGTARYAGGGAGTQTAAVYMSGVFYTAGDAPSLAYKAETEEYDGSSWSESGDVSTARGLCAGCGTQTAALIVGGLSPSYSNATEEYNGSSWTTGGNYLTTMAQFAGAGSQTSALAFGGTAPTPGTGSVLTCNYDGSAWSTQPSLASGKRGMGGTGSTSAGLSFGGATNLATTEEFTGETSASNIQDFTTS